MHILDYTKSYFSNAFNDVCLNVEDTYMIRRDVPVGVPLDLSTPTGMSCIGTYGENWSQTMFQNIVFY